MAREYVKRQDKKEERKEHQDRPYLGTKETSQDEGTVKRARIGVGDLRAVPELFKNGKIDPKYNTSTVADMAQGASIGLQTVRGGNDWQIMGGALGGALGGLFNKNLRGKAIHQADVKETEQYNRDTLAITEATRRANEYELKVTKDAFDQKQKMEKSQRLNAAQTARDEKDKRAILAYNIGQALSIGDTQEAKIYQQELATMNNWQGDYNDLPETYGVGFSKAPVKVGDSLYYTVEGTRKLVQALDQSGMPMSTFTRDQWMNIAKQQVKDKYNEQFASESYSEALQAVEQYEKDGTFNFKTPTGKMNYSQRNAYIKSISEQMLKDKIAGRASTELDLGFTVKAYKPVSTTPALVPAEKVVEANSPFMPPAEETPMVTDAVTGAQTPEGQKQIGVPMSTKGTDVPAPKYEGNPVEDFQKHVEGLSSKSQKTINTAINALKEGEEQPFTVKMNGVQRTIIIGMDEDGKKYVRIQ